VLQEESGLGGGPVDIGAFVPSKSLDVPASARLSLNVPRQVHGTEAAEEEAKARRAELLDLRARLLVDVARTFYAVMTGERRARVLAESVRVADRRVRDLLAREAAGAAAPLEVARGRDDAAKVRTALVDAENAAATGRAMLAYLVGVGSVVGPLVDDVSPPEEPPPPEELVAAALKRREDLHAAAARCRAAEEEVRAAFAESYPSLSLDFTRFFHRESFPPDVDWRAALGLELPIFTAGRIRDDIRTAYSRLRQAKANESRIRRQIEEQVRAARRDVADSARRRLAIAERVDASEEAVRAAGEAHANGMATDLDVLLAEDSRREARLLLTTEKLAGTLRWLLLLRATGELESRLFPDGNQ
jgi:outer membrane protein TolC